MYARLLAVALTAAAVLVGTGSGVGAEVIGKGSVDCIGLTCPDSGLSATAKAQVDWIGSPLSDPRNLKAQKVAGYYEFGEGTTAGQTAVAYVIPPGQLQSVPAAIANLRVVKDISAVDYATGTVVVFNDGAALWAPQLGAQAARATAAKARRGARARAAADAYGCSDSYFCIYPGINFTGGRLQWHDINQGSNWVNLTDWGFNDSASSSRNRRDRDSWLAEHTNGGGDRHCYDSHSSDADFGGWSNDASSLYNSAGDAGC